MKTITKTTFSLLLFVFALTITGLAQQSVVESYFKASLKSMNESKFQEAV